MYTEEDLRATLGALEREAPGEAGVLAGLERARRRRTVRRRTAGVIVAAMATVVAVAGAVVVPQLVGQPDQVAASPHFERWRFMFAVEDIPDYLVYYRSPSSALISSAVAWNKTDLPSLYKLTVFQRGREVPTVYQAGEPVDVRGKRGFYRADLPCECGYTDGVPSVVWEYAPGSWAQVQVRGTMPPDPREAVLRIAGAVRFDRTAVLRVPFRVGYVPAGLQAAAPNHLDTDPIVAGMVDAAVDMAGASRRLTISTVSRRFASGAVSDRPAVTTDPKTGSSVVTINFDQFAVRLFGTGISTDELKRIARSITPVADLSDLTTWFDAEKAIPLH